MELNQEEASRFARLGLACVTRPFPNAPGLVLNREGELQEPRDLHPAFYGCFDWHSSVHTHWMLVRLWRLFPSLPEVPAIIAALNSTLTAENIAAEAAYFQGPNHLSFERPYGWAWILKLAEELRLLPGEEGGAWSRHLKPLEQFLKNQFELYLPRLFYPVRVGTHGNTAFSLGLALEYARSCKDTALEELIRERSLFYYSRDGNCPASWEPGGNDFLSSCLVEAALMSRVLPPAEFSVWFQGFLPEIARGKPENILNPPRISDQTDPQLSHLDGLLLSRAWCLWRIAASLPAETPALPVLKDAAMRQAEAGLQKVFSGEYNGEHWMASFAVYLFQVMAEG